jgi:hypothetical protein
LCWRTCVQTMIESKSAECRHLVILPSHCAASLQLSSAEQATTMRVYAASVANARMEPDAYGVDEKREAFPWLFGPTIR